MFVAFGQAAAEGAAAVVASQRDIPEADSVTVPVLVIAAIENEDDVLLSAPTSQTSTNLVQPVSNSPAHQDPLDINQ
jgi:hypothetical protein